MSSMAAQRWMLRALELARRGQGLVHPNPMVGAVLVKQGRVVGEGFHQAYGGPHAEIGALAKAGKKARGATLYLNLEPCSHWGKTPPCADALIASGIRHVVASMTDPNPKVAGRGFSKLRAAGIRVEVGLFEAQARELNRAFVVYISEKRPFVSLKAASTLDGKIATVTGESKWITSVQARSRGHQLRAEADAIAVGIETVLADNPELTAHGQGRDPIRLIFDSKLRISLQAKVLNREAPTWILTTRAFGSPKRRALEKKGVRVITVDSEKGRVSIANALQALARDGVTHLLVEGGGSLHASFVESRFVDEAWWFLAPTLLGGKRAKTAVAGRGTPALADALPFTFKDVERVGPDLLVRLVRTSKGAHR